MSSLRKPVRSSITLLGIILLLFAAAPLLHAQQIIGTTGFDYSTGKYGGTASTNILFLPFTGEFDLNSDWTLKVTVPYLRISGPGNVLPGLGAVNRPGQATSTTQSGLGDIVTSLAHDFFYDKASGLTLGATAKIKFGTASRDRGLGTGETDEMLQFDVARAFGDWTPFASCGYRFLGKPPGIELHNGLYGSVGATYKIAPASSVGASLDVKEKSTTTGKTLAELSGFVSHRLDARWRMQGYVVAGLTTASPDFGVGGTIGCSF